MRERLVALFEGWERFWLATESSERLVVLRLAIGALSFLWALSLGPDLFLLYAETGVAPEAPYHPMRLGLFRWLESDAALLAGYAALLASAGAVFLGVAMRLSAPVLFVTTTSFQMDNVYVMNAGDQLLRLLCCYLAFYALLTPGGCGPTLLAWWRARSRGEQAVAALFSPVPRWFVRLAQLQLTVIYPCAVVSKLSGAHWLDGTAAVRSLGLVEYLRFPVPDFVLQSPLLGSLLTWSALGLEVVLPLLLWLPETRRLAIVLGVGLHFGLDYGLRIGFFSLVMAAAYLSFLLPSEAGWLLGANRAEGRGMPTRRAAAAHAD